MTKLLKIALFLAASDRGAFVRGLVLAMLVLVMGAALLGLSGWFITAAAAAGLAGTGAVFNVFAPSAAVRFLALARTVARYGERLGTHDTTLRALSALRVRLLQGIAQRPYRHLERMRAASALNRVTADVDVLDGITLRLALPAIAGLVTLLVAAIGLSWLVHPLVGLIVGASYAVIPTLIFLLGQHVASRPARMAEAGTQALRSRTVDLVATRDDLTMYGQLAAARDWACDAALYQEKAQARLDLVDRWTGFALDVTGWIITAVALVIGATLAKSGQIQVASAAIGVFVSLALRETVAPVRRALSEIGRMTSAARRVAPALALSDQEPVATPLAQIPAVLQLCHVAADRAKAGRPIFAPVSFQVAPGETVALTGRSGSGKSTLLLVAAGQLMPCKGTVTFAGAAPSVMLTRIAMVPQRAALLAGTIAENLRLAAPEATDADLWHALRATCLSQTVADRGGLTLKLGFRGAGLSGGEARRLVLARALLRRPDLLILDEPTEGLDDPTARAVLAGLRAALPDAAILLAAHRPAETDMADRVVRVNAAA